MLLPIPPFRTGNVQRGTHRRLGPLKSILGVGGLPPSSWGVVRPIADELHKRAFYRMGVIRARALRTYKIRVGNTHLKGAGLYNRGRKVIPAKTEVAWFSGVIVPAKGPFFRSTYLMEMGTLNFGKKKVKVVLDGTKSLGMATHCNGSLINHSCTPNCEVRMEYEDLDLPLPIVVTLRDIQPGEELTIDYGNKYWYDDVTGARILSRNPPPETILRCMCAWPSACPNRYFQRVY